MSWNVRSTANLEEFRAAVGAISHYFGGGPDDDRAERFAKVLPLERMHAAFDGGRVVGGAGAFPFELTVPGGVVPCGGVTVVGVLPTHRRRGVLTEMMRVQIEDIRDRGEPIAALWASEEVIYGRFGYGMASLAGEVQLPGGYTGLRHPPEESARSRLVTLEDEAPEHLGAPRELRRGGPQHLRGAGPSCALRPSSLSTDAWMTQRWAPRPSSTSQAGNRVGRPLAFTMPCAVTAVATVTSSTVSRYAIWNVVLVAAPRARWTATTSSNRSGLT